MLKHYVIVRRDLPLGVMAAMVLHAAAESKAAQIDRFYQDSDWPAPHDIAVVLGVDSELTLFRVFKTLQDAHVMPVGITESGGPYDGQLMAVGVLQPGPETEIDCLKNLRLLRDLFIDPVQAAITQAVVEVDNDWAV